MLLGISYETVITYIAIFIGVILFLLILAAPLKHLFKVLTNCMAGTVGLIVFNFIGGFIGVTLGINPASILTIGLLGIPGFLLIVFLKYFLA